jgi:hypothetical protein
MDREYRCAECGAVRESVRSSRQTCGDRCRQRLHRRCREITAQAEAERRRLEMMPESDVHRDRVREAALDARIAAGEFERR